ncbi:hypothetical protein EWU19_25635 [Salmonella enterica subsp. enterica serovar Heidelberg]|nr:hypothetical protein [Salmonella enterica subsp. enterica serovar Heidelberg]
MFGASGLGKSHLAAAIVDGVVAQVPGPVLQRRRLWRESEKLRRYKKEARLPVAKTLNEYDFSQVPELNGAQFRQLCETTDWVDAGENVLLFGASGLGKSHLAAAIVDGVVAQVPGPVLQRRRVAAGAAQSQSAAETE